MLLTMDIGNTNVKIGVFDNDQLKHSWRVSTVASHTADEYGMTVLELFGSAHVSVDSLDGIIISSVAPSLNYTIEHMCDFYLKKRPIFVDYATDTGIKITYAHPKELGSDRIVGASAAYYIYGGPCIVVDFGSATTFNLVSADGTFLGGAIAPGIKTATESLVQTAAKLPRIELVNPKNVVGTSTTSCMQSGIIFGYTGLVEYLVRRFKEQAGMENAKVVATGGLSELIAGVDKGVIDVIDRALALKGLNLIFNRVGKSQN